MWTKDEGSRDVQNACWVQVEGSPGFKLSKNLEKKKTSKDLKVWNKTLFGLVKERIKALQSAIYEIQQNLKPPSKENLETETALNLELGKWLSREE